MILRAAAARSASARRSRAGALATSYPTTRSPELTPRIGRGIAMLTGDVGTA